jgi:hypothetical protein
MGGKILVPLVDVMWAAKYYNIVSPSLGITYAMIGRRGKKEGRGDEKKVWGGDSTNLCAERKD